MPSTYLQLSNLQKSVSGDTIVWNNLPTLGASTRECYIRVEQMDVIFGVALTHEEILVKANLPTSNYYSSNNDLPVVRYLSSADNKLFAPLLEGSIKLLSNDNLKRLEFQLFSSDGTIIDLTNLTSINVTLEMMYVDQKAMTETYLEEIPKHMPFHSGGR